jgi:hypothetical protein
MARTATSKTTETHEGYCPHCFLLVEKNVTDDWPAAAIRCPHCRLLIGPGRGRPTADASPGARGSAAGVFAHQAKREDGDDVSLDEVRAAIRRVAEELGSRPERLLMVDYQQRVTADDSLPSLSDVFSAFGSWKRARREAAL